MLEQNTPISAVKSLRPFYVMEILARAQELEKQGVDVIHLEIGEPDFATPIEISEAAVEFIRRGRVTYTPSTGITQLREAIAAHYLQHYRVLIEPSRIIVTPGATGAMLLALGLLLEPGRRMLLADPGYPCYANLVRLFGGESVTVPVDARTKFQLTAKAVSERWDTHVAGVILASPSNPTGTLIERSELGNLIERVASLGGRLVSDEIYHGLEYQTQSPTALSWSDDVLVVNSFSKYFGMTGWRIGWAVVPAELTRQAEILSQNLFISPPAPSQYAAIAAFSDSCTVELERRRGEFAQRRQFLIDGLRSLDLTIPVEPQGAFYVYADVSAYTTDSFTFARELLERLGVATTPGRDFGQHRCDAFLRFAYTTSIPRLSEAIRRIEGFLR